jgi:hypothetical protein
MTIHRSRLHFLSTTLKEETVFSVLGIESESSRARRRQIPPAAPRRDWNAL